VQTGGRRDEGRGGQGARESDADPAGSKVVRIPREWFGPRDELVPLGPRAPEAGSSRPGEGRGEAAPPMPSRPSLDANAFWGEDASSIHDVLEGPAGGQPRSLTGATGPPRGSAPRRSADRAQADREDKPRRARLHGRAFRPGMVAAAATLAALAAASVARYLAPPPPRELHTAVGSVTARSFTPAVTHSGGLREILAVTRAKRSVEGGLSRPSRRARRPVPHRSAIAPTSSIQVAYHPAYPPPTSPSPPPENQSTPAAAASGPASGTPTRPGGAATTASATPSSTPAKPAFGANGALGPMSSPDG
jgi:hypothetical protein